MSADNSVAPAPLDAKADARPAFSIPDELEARYRVRLIESADGVERRVGLFLARDPVSPALEIRDDRIVARHEDPDTIASLVRLARHNGWERIDVDGSAEFRKAVGAAAGSEGLTVDGYVPSFAEQERIEAARGGAGRASQPKDVSDTTGPDGKPGVELFDSDRRLLVTLTRHLEDRRMLSAIVEPGLSAFERQVHIERIELNRQALDTTLERTLESRSLGTAFRQVGLEPAALREMSQRGHRDGEMADAIYRVRAALDPREVARETRSDKAPIVELAAAALDRSTEGPGGQTGRHREVEAGLVRQERQRGEAAERLNEREELAELFLDGAADTIATDPRLANAVRAQGAMEQHIAELFEGDTARAVAANLESRQMISDVLRRGLDVSVREPAPVRQLAPIQTLEVER